MHDFTVRQHDLTFIGDGTVGCITVAKSSARTAKQALLLEAVQGTPSDFTPADINDVLAGPTTFAPMPLIQPVAAAVTMPCPSSEWT